MSNERGTGKDWLLVPLDEAQIPSQVAQSVPVIQFVTGSDPYGYILYPLSLRHLEEALGACLNLRTVTIANV